MFENVFIFAAENKLERWSRESSMKEKSSLFGSEAFNTEFFFLFYKTGYLNMEVNCTKPYLGLASDRRVVSDGLECYSH